MSVGVCTVVKSGTVTVPVNVGLENIVALDSLVTFPSPIYDLSIVTQVAFPFKNPLALVILGAKPFSVVLTTPYVVSEYEEDIVIAPVELSTE